MTHITWDPGTEPCDPPEPPIELSPDAPHRGRRAEDREEKEIRARVWEGWVLRFCNETPHSALMAALDEYRDELGMLALRRLGLRGTR